MGGLEGYLPTASTGSSEQTVPAWVPTSLQGTDALTRYNLLEGFGVCTVHLTTLSPLTTGLEGTAPSILSSGWGSELSGVELTKGT